MAPAPKRGNEVKMSDLPKHVALADVDWLPLGDTGWHRASVNLHAGDTADNPASTKELVYGPCIITYERAPDGGITAIVERHD